MEQTRIRFWQGFSLALALALAAMAAGPVHSVFAQSDRKQRFTEIDVERINIREADGTVKLVIANRERAPDQVSEGQSRPRATSGSRACRPEPSVRSSRPSLRPAAPVLARRAFFSARATAGMQFSDLPMPGGGNVFG